MKKLNKKIISLFIFFVLLVFGGFMLKDGFMYLNKFSSSDYQEIQTNAGLKILFLKDESLPSIQYKILFPKAGSDYDFEGKSGLSYLTALLSEQGAGGLSSEVLQEELNQLGTGLGIQVGRQTVSITLSGLSWHGEKLWDLFGKILTEPHFQEEEIEILRKQLLDQRLKSLDSPSAVASELWRKEIFKGSVGGTRQGTLDSLSKITLEDVKRFYKQKFQEGEPILTVVGQYDKKLKKNIISFFEKSFSSHGKKSENFSIPQPSTELKLLTKEDLVQAHIFLGYPISSFPVDEPRKFLALKTANSILGGDWNMVNRLFTGLREEKGLTYSTVSYIDFGKLYGIFLLSGSTKTSSVREFLEQALVILKTFREKGIHLEEFKRAKQELKSRYLKHIETPESRLNQFVYYTHYLGVDPNFLENYLDILNDISLDEMNQLIKEFILSKPLQLVVYGHPSLKSQLEGLEGFPSLQVLSFEDYFKEELNFQSLK